MSAIDLSALPDLSRADLAERWQACYGTAPPKGISRRLMAGAVAYAEQAKQQGGPSAALQRRLAKLASGAPIAKVAAPPALKTGARLVREWNGVTHVIEVAETGFVWKGCDIVRSPPSPAPSPARAGRVHASSEQAHEKVAALRDLHA